MIVLTSKKYEVDETIKAENENGETIYEFQMQLTGAENKEINEIIINEESLKIAKNYNKLNDEDKEKADQRINEITIANQERFEDICFKEHKAPFKEAVGEFKYLEMTEAMFDFFWKAFIGKKAERSNTMISDLRKISGN